MLKLPIHLATLLLLVSATQGQSATQHPSTDPWEIIALTDQPSVTLELPALNTVRGSIFEVRPVLLVRCQENELEVFVSAGFVLQAEDQVVTPVRIQWGAQAPTETRWNRSTDSTSAFVSDPRAFLRQLVSHPDVRLEIHPSAKAPHVIRFNARGLERHIPKIDAACPLNAKGDERDSIPDQVYSEQIVDRRPDIVSALPLDYPQALRLAGLQGRVIVQAVIDTLGRAEPASLKIVQRPYPGFEESARDYVLHAVFQPARVKGRAVRVRLSIPIDYKIN